MNIAVLIGRLGMDPELKFTGNNTAVCRLRVVTDNVWYNDKGEKQQKSTWHTCIFWGKQGETVAKYFSKGDQIGIAGEIENRQWEDKNGVKHYASEIKCHSFEFGQKAQANQQQRGHQGRGWGGGETGGDFGHTAEGEAGDDDIPF
jgi:single-strand DNA-binding protein